MVAIVSGEGLGLSTTSLSTLRSQGLALDAAQGRGNERLYLNVANGNLVIQSLDEHLLGPGLAIDSLRTYNSQGKLDDDEAPGFLHPGWLEVEGKVGSPESRIRRIDAEGHVSVYSWDEEEESWRNTDGDGAYDSIRYDKSSKTLIWTDGGSGVCELHQQRDDGWQLTARLDLDGNRIDFSYDRHGRLVSVLNRNGEGSWYEYRSAGDDSVLAQISTVTRDGSGKASSVRVRYGYDSHERLRSVTVDLSPEDGSVADGRSTQTRYEYEGDSHRIRAVIHDDGSFTRFTYTKRDGDWRVASFSNALGETTRIDYDGDSTTVTDPLGRATRYRYDEHGQLERIAAPAIDGESPLTRFEWNGRGDLVAVTDALGRVSVMDYDGNGNQIRVRDAAGNVVTRKYSEYNLLLSETVWLVPDPDGAGRLQPAEPRSTRYVYDARRHLRFVISPQGRVTEYRYNGSGQRSSQIGYASGWFDEVSGKLSEARLADWAASQDARQILRTEYVWDFRGQLQQERRFGPSGCPDDVFVTAFVYDAFGLLLQTVTPEGGVTRNTWDGLGRLLTSTNALGHTTLTHWDDLGNQVAVQTANGLLKSSVYDRAGRLVAQVDSDPQGQVLGSTCYRYDAAGHLLSVQDATGIARHFLYDAAGRQVGEIDGRGALAENVYDANNQLVQVIRYATPVTLPAPDAAIWSSHHALARLRPPASADDSKTWRMVDAANRLVGEIDAEGALIRHEYDGAGRLLRTLRYATAVAIAELGSMPRLERVLPPAAAEDRIIRNFYDGDGLLRGVLDAEGYLTEQRHDAAGRMVERIQYARATDLALREAGTLDQLRPASDESDAVEHSIYDTRGLLLAQVDAESYLTRYQYDGSGNVVQEIRHAQALEPAQLAALVDAGLAGSALPGSDSRDHIRQYRYDLLGQLTLQMDAAGTLTRYGYDNMGRLIETVQAADTGEARATTRRFDLRGRLLAELDGEGSAALVGVNEESAIDAVWRKYATRYRYDAAGRLQSQTDANGLRNLYFHDANGQRLFAINAMGEVEGHQYDLLRNETVITRYATRLDGLVLAQLEGGLADASLLSRLRELASPELDASVRKRYDRRGRLIASIDALGSRIDTRRDCFGQIVESSQWVQGHLVVQALQWNRRGLQTLRIDDASGLAASTSWTYDAFGRVMESRDAIGGLRSQSWDRLGRQVQTVDALGAKQSSAWDAFSRELIRVDALGHATRFVYDDDARRLRVTTPEGISTTTIYNRHQQLQQVIDGNGNSTHYRYDRNGKVLAIDAPLGTQFNRYDRANRLLESIDARGVSTTLSYDAANRLLTRTVDAEGLALSTRFQWDALGRQLRIESPGGTVTEYEYDRQGQLIRQTLDPQGLALSTRYRWDERGRQLAVIDASGVTTLTRWDALGRRLEDLLDPDGLALATRYIWDARGNLLETIDANGASSRYIHDAENRLLVSIDGAGGVITTQWNANGRVVKQIRHARSLSGSVLSDLEPDPTDIAIHTLYDRDGRVTHTISSGGSVLALRYDGNGNLIERRAYAQAIDMRSWTPGAVPAVLADDAHDARLRLLYDAANRVIATLDGIGALSLQSWDANGNLLARTGFATGIDPDTALYADSIALLADTIARPDVDRREEHLYDAANRRIASRDGLGAVTRFSHDANGQLLQSIAFATPSPDNWLPPTSDADRITHYLYDTANRLQWQVDAMGAVTQWLRDASGNVLTEIAYAQPLALDSSLNFNAAILQTAVTQDASRDRIQRHAYDHANRRVYSIDAEGAVSAWRYDGLGRSTQSTRLATAISLAELSGLDRLDKPDCARLLWIEAHLVPDLRQDRSQYSFYNAAGQLLASLDALGFVTRYHVDALGRILGVTRHARAVGVPVPALSLAALQAAIEPDAADRSEHYRLDAGSRIMSHTDALGHTEAWTYDALGNRLSYCNALGACWDYAYDAAGRQVWERAPEITLTAVTRNVSGDLQQDFANSGAVNLLTQLRWDALGSLIERIEAVGRAEARSTRYRYDALGRQIVIDFPGMLLDGGTVRALHTATHYDVLGNAVSGRDAAGQYAHKTWDRMGRVEFEIDALGQVTEYRRNAFGDVVTLIRHEQAISLPANYPLTSQQIRAALRPGQDRSLIQTYDRAGRLLATRQDAALVIDISNLAQAIFARPETSLAYNAFGEQIETRQLQSAISGASLLSRQTYDQDGRVIASQDVAGYLSTQTWDAFGNLLEKVEYAAPAGEGDSSASQDRITRYLWDGADRKLAEIQTGIALDDIAGAGAAAELIMRYQYDAVGNLIATTDAKGQLSHMTYDALGHLIASSAPPRPDASGQDITPLSTYGRDAFGKLVLQRDAAAGASEVERIALYRYDSHGQLLQSTDALGASRHQSWDALGRLSQNWQTVTEYDGRKRTLTTIYRYDALGRLLSEIDAGSDTPRSKDSAWNAFGEQIAAGIDGVWDRRLEYDQLGRLWKSTTNGLIQVSLHDLQGNVVIGLESDGSRAFDVSDPIAALQASGTRRTDMRYDALGRLLEQTGPAQSASILQAEAGILRLLGSKASQGAALFIRSEENSAWRALAVEEDVDGSYTASTAGLAAGHYLWRLEPAGQASRQGELQIIAAQEAQSIPAQGLPAAELPRIRLGSVGGVASGIDASAFLAWGNAGSDSAQTFFYRKADLDGDWNELPVHALGDGYFGVDRRAVAAGHYAYQILIDLPDGGQRKLSGDVSLGLMQVVGQSLLLRDAQGNAENATQGVLLQWSAPPAGQSAQLWALRDGGWQPLELQPETLGVGVDGKPICLLKAVLDAGWQGQRVDLQFRILDEAGAMIALRTGLLDWFGAASLPAWLDSTPSFSPGALRPAIARQVTVSGNHSLRPTVLQQFDRWGNLLSRSDARNADWTTRWRYGFANRMLEEARPNGAGQADSVTRYGHDLLGQLQSVEDANGNITRYHYDAGGQRVAEVQADGGIVQHEYDVLGNQIKSVDALGNVVLRSFDLLGQRTARHTGSGVLIESSHYDEAGRRIVATNGAGEATRYRYDSRGNLLEVILPLGQVTRIEYDSHDRRIAEVDPLGRVQTWTWDAAGRLGTHTDLGGVQTLYQYDHAGQLVRQTSGHGQDLRKEYDAAGNLLRQIDMATATTSEYGWDAAGNRNLERSTRAGEVLQDQHIRFDSQNRMVQVIDSASGRAEVRIAYDAAGNRIRIDTEIDSLGVQQYNIGWYVYDVMNRQVLVNGSSPEQLGSQGRQVQYDQVGRRISETWFGQAIAQSADSFGIEPGLTTASYLWDEQNRLSAVLRDGVLVEQRRYDAAGRVIYVGGGSLNQGQVAQLNAGVSEADRIADTLSWNSYDANGQLRHVYALNLDGSRKFDLSYFYDASGKSTQYQVHVPGDDGYTNTFTLAYEARDSDLLVATYGSSTTYQAGASYRQYDANGYLTGITDQANGANNRGYLNDASGAALVVRQAGVEQRQLIANGQVLGRYGTGQDPVQGKDSDNNPRFASGADLNFSWQVVNGAHPGPQPARYTIRFGDTLQAIAQQQYGDSALWYVIADANGLSEPNALLAGQKLDLPALAGASANRADTFKPYDASQLIGDTTPTMPLPPPDDGGCGVLGALLVVVIAVAITVMTSGIGGAALGSIVSQGVGIALGVQREFSWAAVGLSALSAGVSGALSGYAAFSGAASSMANTVARTALANTLTQGIGVMTGLQSSFSWQGVAASALGSGVGWMAGDTLGMQTQQFGKAGFGERLLKTTLSGLAAATTTALARGGRVAVQQVAVDVFGNALGNGLVELGWSATASGAGREKDVGYGYGDGDFGEPLLPNETSDATYHLHSTNENVIGADGTPGLRTTDVVRSAYADALRRVETMEVKQIFDSTDPHQYLIFVANDGTRNDANQAMPTNPRALYSLAQAANNERTVSIYVSGVGTDFDLGGVNSALGLGMATQIAETTTAITKAVNGIAQNDPDAKFIFVDTGFSRGSSVIRTIQNVLVEQGVPELKSGKEMMDADGRTTLVYGRHLIAPGEINIGASLIFDSVSTGIGSFSNMAIPSQVQQTLHLTAANEYRTFFPLTSALPLDRALNRQIAEWLLPGSHTNLGGGSYDSNGIGAANLEIGYVYLKRAGVPLAPLPAGMRPIADQFAIYDSRWIKSTPFGQMVNNPSIRRVINHSQ
jgi:YD repeat-containing protein